MFPNLKVDRSAPEKARASKSVAIRRLEGTEGQFVCDGDVTVEDVDRVDMHLSGKGQMLILFALTPGDEPSTSVLALFDVSDAPKLLDIAEAPSPFPDGHGWPSDGGLLHLSDSMDALVISYEHHNSNESAQEYAPVFVDRGKNSN